LCFYWELRGVRRELKGVKGEVCFFFWRELKGVMGDKESGGGDAIVAV